MALEDPTHEVQVMQKIIRDALEKIRIQYGLRVTHLDAFWHEPQTPREEWQVKHLRIRTEANFVTRVK